MLKVRITWRFEETGRSRIRHDPRNVSLALYEFKDASLSDVIQALNSISENKIDLQEIEKRQPYFRRFSE